MAWVVWAFVGLLPWLAFFVWAWLARGIKPIRFVWPAVPQLNSAREAEERLLAPRMSANKMFYGPLALVGVVAGVWAIVDLGAIGAGVLTCVLTPPLLAGIATLRAWLAVRRFER